MKILMALLAVTFLIAYVLFIVIAVFYPTSFNAEMATALATIGGLVSALVVAELAVTGRGEVPVARVLGNGATDDAPRTRKTLSILYLAVWVVCGALCWIYGLVNTGASEVVANVGSAWFGTALAAIYAYFQIQPRAERVVDLGDQTTSTSHHVSPA